MSTDSKTYFTAVLAIHATTTEPGEPVVRRDSYNRISGSELGKPVKSSAEVLKLQLKGSTMAEVAAKASSVLGALEESL